MVVLLILGAVLGLGYIWIHYVMNHGYRLDLKQIKGENMTEFQKHLKVAAELMTEEEKQDLESLLEVHRKAVESLKYGTKIDQ